MANIRMIPFADKVIKEEDGKSFIEKSNETERPAILTNFALNWAHKKGILPHTKMNELIDIADEDVEMSWKMIYVGVIGANPSLANQMSMDDFIKTLDIDWNEVCYIASSLFFPDLPASFKEWVDNLPKVTNTDQKKS